jgi:hypothetical protein
MDPNRAIIVSSSRFRDLDRWPIYIYLIILDTKLATIYLDRISTVNFPRLVKNAILRFEKNHKKNAILKNRSNYVYN